MLDSFVTSWTITLLGFSVHEISQVRILEWVAISFSRGSSWPSDWTCISYISRWSLYHWAIWEATCYSRGFEERLQSKSSECLCPAIHHSWKKTGRGNKKYIHVPFTTISASVQLISHVRLFATPWSAACQASLSIPSSRSLPKLMSIESVMPSNHLILCRPLLWPSIFTSIRVFSNEPALRIRWPKYWSFSFNISSSSEHPGLISFRMD